MLDLLKRFRRGFEVVLFCYLSGGMCLFVNILFYFFVFEEKGKKEEPESYNTATIDTKHKVKDHYNVHEKLGV